MSEQSEIDRLRAELAAARERGSKLESIVCQLGAMNTKELERAGKAKAELATAREERDAAISTMEDAVLAMKEKGNIHRERISQLEAALLEASNLLRYGQDGDLKLDALIRFDALLVEGKEQG